MVRLRPRSGVERGRSIDDAGRLRLTTAVMAGRAATAVCRFVGRGGTSLPGLISLRLEPRAVRMLSSQLGDGSIVVAGTNGKTTTCAWTAAAMTAGGKDVLRNSEGSNMMRGVATTLVGETSITGRVRRAHRRSGLFEADEAALPTLLEELQPRILTITNLFRDQLDRYGEIATTAGRWRVAMSRLPTSTRVILNADDPLVTSLADGARGPVVFYGIANWAGDTSSESRPALSADSLFCPRCAVALSFTSISYAHLGHYHCEACGYSRPTPQVCASASTVDAASTVVEMRAFGDSAACRVALPGRYNVYNALAATATAVVAGTPLAEATRAIGDAHGAFGRAESVMVDGLEVRLFLIKNPTGADEVFRVVASGDHDGTLVLLLSDNAADGEDVSWIWDASIEILAPWTGPVLCGGTRAEDMALRLKYGGQREPVVVVPRDVAQAVQRSIDMTTARKQVNILATYTAMLDARSALARAGHVEQYWSRKP